MRNFTVPGRSAGTHRALLLGTCGALVVAALGDEATGYDGPGPFVCLALVLLVGLVPGRYAPLGAAAGSAVLLVGGLASSAFVHQLLDTARPGPLVAGWAQMAGLAVAAASAVAAAVLGRRPTT